MRHWIWCDIDQRIPILTSAPPRSILILSCRYHIISNASLVNNCIISPRKYDWTRTVFWIFWVTFVTIHVLCFATGQNETVDHPFLTFWKIKWYFSDIAVSFNFLVIGIDSFDKNILKMLLNRVKLDFFRLYHFAPTTLYHFAPVTSCLLFS